jgi:release factor glutamine methyltransferase
MPDELNRIWTIRELMKLTIDHLRQKGFEDARLNVELLLAHALDLQRIQLYLHFNKPLTAEELKRFRALYERRLHHEPVQYIIGSTNFMGLQFKVDSHVLIPRPETEILIEQVIMACQRYSSDDVIHILEVGTGSGNIAIAIAKFVKYARITTIDNSREALNVAEHNARLHAVDSRIQFLQADIFDETFELTNRQFDMIVSNPPYVPQQEWEQLQSEVRDFEPRSAVTDGNDGFTFYRRMLTVIPNILKNSGQVLFEVGFDQAEHLIHELKHHGFEQLRAVHDLQGIPRVVLGEWKMRPHSMIHLN